MMLKMLVTSSLLSFIDSQGLGLWMLAVQPPVLASSMSPDFAAKVDMQRMAKATFASPWRCDALPSMRVANARLGCRQVAAWRPAFDRSRICQGPPAGDLFSVLLARTGEDKKMEAIPLHVRQLRACRPWHPSGLPPTDHACLVHIQHNADMML